MYRKELKAETQMIFRAAFITHNSQMVEVTQVFTDGWMVKQNEAGVFNGVSFSLEKEGHADT
jgi:hypothetical protein